MSYELKVRSWKLGKRKEVCPAAKCGLADFFSLIQYVTSCRESSDPSAVSPLTSVCSLLTH